MVEMRVVRMARSLVEMTVAQTALLTAGMMADQKADSMVE